MSAGQRLLRQAGKSRFYDHLPGADLARLLGTDDDREIFFEFDPALFISQYCQYAKFNRKQVSYLNRFLSDRGANAKLITFWFFRDPKKPEPESRH